MNDDFVVENASAFTERVASVSSENLEEKIEKAYLLALSREPSCEEVQIAWAHLGCEEDLYLKSNAVPDQARKEALKGFCHLLFLTNEFLYID